MNILPLFTSFRLTSHFNMKLTKKMLHVKLIEFSLYVAQLNIQTCKNYTMIKLAENKTLYFKLDCNANRNVVNLMAVHSNYGNWEFYYWFFEDSNNTKISHTNNWITIFEWFNRHQLFSYDISILLWEMSVWYFIKLSNSGKKHFKFDSLPTFQPINIEQTWIERSISSWLNVIQPSTNY